MSTNILSEINSDELDFRKYYIKELHNPPKEYLNAFSAPISLAGGVIATALWKKIGGVKGGIIGSVVAGAGLLAGSMFKTSFSTTMKDVSIEEIEGQIAELELRMKNFITLNTLKNIVVNDSLEDDTVASALGVKIIPIYLTPMLPRSKRIDLIKKIMMGEDALGKAMPKNNFYDNTFVAENHNYKYLQQIPKDDVADFLEKLIELSIEYSIVFGDKSSDVTLNNTVKKGTQAALKWVGNKAKEIYRAAAPADAFKVKLLLGAMYISIGHYIINREYLKWEQHDSVEEALEAFRKAKTLDMQKFIGFLVELA
ncbi:MAG: hypothetical protein IKA17_01930 [Clostridia bacterium]|nr:hypothetical protein [Clostridia bacterium]